MANKYKMKIVLVGAALLLIVVGLVAHRYLREYRQKPSDSNRQLLYHIANILIDFHNKNNQFPGNGNRDDLTSFIISTSLSPEIKVNSVRDGKIVDSYGNEVQIRTSSRLGVFITTAGKNGLFGDNDDYRIYEQFNPDPGLKFTELGKMWDKELGGI